MPWYLGLPLENVLMMAASRQRPTDLPGNQGGDEVTLLTATTAKVADLIETQEHRYLDLEERLRLWSD
jgi:hypothetical protein